MECVNDIQSGNIHHRHYQQQQYTSSDDDEEGEEGEEAIWVASSDDDSNYSPASGAQQTLNVQLASAFAQYLAAGRVPTRPTGQSAVDQARRLRKQQREEEMRTAASKPRRIKIKHNFSSEFPTDESYKEEMTCNVCQEEMTLENDCHYRVVILGCGNSHMLCYRCASKLWVQAQTSTQQRICPFCREPFEDFSEIPRVFKALMHEKMTTVKRSANNVKIDPQVLRKEQAKQLDPRYHVQETATGAAATTRRQSRPTGARRAPSGPRPRGSSKNDGSRYVSSRAESANSNFSRASNFRNQRRCSSRRAPSGPAFHRQASRRASSRRRPGEAPHERDPDVAGPVLTRTRMSAYLGMLTTGTVISVNVRKKCAGIRMDEITPNDADDFKSIIFFFGDCVDGYRFVERGDRVSLRLKNNPHPNGGRVMAYDVGYLGPS